MAHSTSDNPVKVTSALARTYAKSLMELAETAGPEVVEQVAQELADIVDLLRATPDLKALFDSPAVNAAKRAVSLEKIFKGQVSDLTYRFIQVVNDKGRLDQFGVFKVAFDQALMDKRGQVEVEICTATELPASQAEQIGKNIGTALNCIARVSSRVDPAMIGGLKLRIGDKLIDGSVATRLAAIKRQMIEKGHESIRAGAQTMLEGN